MSERIKPFIPKDSNKLEFFGNNFTPVELIEDFLHNPSNRHWHFGWSEPEFWRFANRLIIPGGKMLDLGMGFGKNTFMFALYGMNVRGYDNDPNVVKVVSKIAEEYDLPIRTGQVDIRDHLFEPNFYDTILLNQTFIHFPSKNEAFEVIRKAFIAAKKGGYVWLRAAGKCDDRYESYEFQSQWPYSGVERIDADVFEAYCNCSGEEKLESHLFFESLEVLKFFAGNKMRIVYSQVIPNQGSANIMFGEDWQEGKYKSRWGFITILAQK